MCPKKESVAEGDEHLLLPFREQAFCLPFSQGGDRNGLTLGYIICHLRRQFLRSSFSFSKSANGHRAERTRIETIARNGDHANIN
jgi:hypothetical protein